MIGLQDCGIQCFPGNKFLGTCERNSLKGKTSDKGNVKFSSFLGGGGPILYFDPRQLFHNISIMKKKIPHIYYEGNLAMQFQHQNTLYFSSKKKLNTSHNGLPKNCMKVMGTRVTRICFHFSYNNNSSSKVTVFCLIGAAAIFYFNYFTLQCK
jgi:hypothetical protein